MYFIDKLEKSYSQYLLLIPYENRHTRLSKKKCNTTIIKLIILIKRFCLDKTFSLLIVFLAILLEDHLVFKSIKDFFLYNLNKSTFLLQILLLL